MFIEQEDQRDDWITKYTVPQHDRKTSHGRFHHRIFMFRVRRQSVLVHHFWWFTHNCIAHPLIGVLPLKRLFDFHDFTSLKINGR